MHHDLAQLRLHTFFQCSAFTAPGNGARRLIAQRPAPLFQTLSYSPVNGRWPTKNYRGVASLRRDAGQCA
jgi:hypothetical protein